jgi:hypothetical protein
MSKLRRFQASLIFSSSAALVLGTSRNANSYYADQFAGALRDFVDLRTRRVTRPRVHVEALVCSHEPLHAGGIGTSECSRDRWVVTGQELLLPVDEQDLVKESGDLVTVGSWSNCFAASARST